MGYVYVIATVALGLFGQVVLKWQINDAGTMPAEFSGKLDYFGRLLTNPWVLLALGGAVIAALCWFAALTELDLSKAYPFLGLSFGLVLIVSALAFGEPITIAKVTGVLMIMAGVVIAARG
jgi:multidrug transporter EmrE-like cation transporter